MNMKMMACIINDDVCLVRCICPVCGKMHYVSDYLWSYMDYADNGPVTGRYDGWDDAMDIICEECTGKAEVVYGQGIIRHLLEAGELDYVNELARPLIYIPGGALKSLQRSDYNGRNISEFYFGD